MARRERTTGLPRPKPRHAAATDHRFAFNDRISRFVILGSAAALLLVILGFVAYRIYDEQIGRPNSTVLTVGDEKFSLSYYADRLGPFLQANSGGGDSVSILEESLLNKLQSEAIEVDLARERGIDLSRDAVTAFIAGQLGVTVGGSNSSFDTLYRNQLRTLAMSDGSYRRLKEAELANGKLSEQIASEVGDKGDQYTVRAVVVATKEAADAIKARVEKGESLGTIAQTESLDLQSRQQDGLLPPSPLELFPDSARTELEGKAIGALLGPILVVDNWWVFSLETKEPADYDDQQKSALTQLRLDAVVKQRLDELRAKGDLKKSLDSSDIDWAEGHLN